MFVQRLFQIALGVVGVICAFISVYAVVESFRGDDGAPPAAVFFGVLAVVAFALLKPVSWLVGKVLDVITPPLRKAMAAIPRPRWRGPRWVPQATGLLVAASTTDAIGVFHFLSGDDEDDDPESDWTAEELAAERHMRAYGFPDARLTEPRGKEGTDIVAETAVARVTLQDEPVSTPLVRRLRDTRPELASHSFYSTAGFTKIAVVTADKIGVHLFHLDRSRGVVEPVNAGARRLTGRDAGV